MLFCNCFFYAVLVEYALRCPWNTLSCSLCTRRNYTVRPRCLFHLLPRVYLCHAQNALSFVRKYGLEFFQPLAAPQPTKNHVQRLRWVQVMDITRYQARKRGSSQTDADAAMAYFAGRRRPQGFRNTNNEVKRRRWSRVPAERGTTNAGNA